MFVASSMQPKISCGPAVFPSFRGVSRPAVCATGCCTIAIGEHNIRVLKKPGTDETFPAFRMIGASHAPDEPGKDKLKGNVPKFPESPLPRAPSHPPGGCIRNNCKWFSQSFDSIFQSSIFLHCVTQPVMRLARVYSIDQIHAEPTLKIPCLTGLVGAVIRAFLSSSLSNLSQRTYCLSAEGFLISAD